MCFNAKRFWHHIFKYLYPGNKNVSEIQWNICERTNAGNEGAAASFVIWINQNNKMIVYKYTPVYLFYR